MSRSFKVAALVAVTAMILAAPVFAQQSNTFKSTVELYKTDVDKATHVHDYTDVKIEKWAGFIGYGGSTNNDPIQLGFAKNFSSLFLGTWYSGNIVSVSEDWDKTATTTYDLNEQIIDDIETVTRYLNNANRNYTSNQAAALIGIAGMGFKVGFAEQLTKISYPNRTITVIENKDGTVSHTNGDIYEYYDIEGSITPSLQWGMKLPVSSITLKPRATFRVGINLNKSTDDLRPVPYTTIDGEVVGQEQINRGGNESGYVAPNIIIGSDFVFEKFTLGFNYDIKFDVYNNKYDAAGFTGKTKGTVSWSNATSYNQTNTSIATTQTTDNAVLTINEYEKIPVYNNIGLYFITKKEIAEGLNLGFKTGTSLRIDTRTSDAYQLTLNKAETRYNNEALSADNTRTDTETRTFGTTTDYTRFYMDPYVSVGATYALFPGRFTINAGIKVTPFTYESIVTRTAVQNGNVQTIKTYNSRGDLITDTVTVTNGTQTTDTVGVNNAWNYLGAAVYGGFLFNFTENMALDAYFGATGAQRFELDIMEFNVLFSVKF